MNKRYGIFLLFASLLLTACSDEKIPFVYRIDVQQGNIVTQDMLIKLKPGYDKRKVTHIMGTPLIVDVFHQDDWIYLYSYQKGGGDRHQRRITLHFENDSLKSISGDVTQADRETLSSANNKRKNLTVNVPDGYGKQSGFFDDLIEDFTFFEEEKSYDPALPPEHQSLKKPATPVKATEENTLDEPVEEKTTEEAIEALPEDKKISDDFRKQYSLESQDVPLSNTTPEDESKVNDKTAEEPGFFERMKRAVGIGDE